MAHVIYNVKTIKIQARYDSERGAKVALTRKYKKDPDLKITTVSDFFQNVDYTVVVNNLMSNLPVTIRKSEQGTCVDPSTERYWTM